MGEHRGGVVPSGIKGVALAVWCSRAETLPSPPGKDGGWAPPCGALASLRFIEFQLVQSKIV